MPGRVPEHQARRCECNRPAGDDGDSGVRPQSGYEYQALSQRAEGKAGVDDAPVPVPFFHEHERIIRHDDDTVEKVEHHQGEKERADGAHRPRADRSATRRCSAVLFLAE